MTGSVCVGRNMKTRYLLRRASLIVASVMFPIKILCLAILFGLMIAWPPFGAAVLGDRWEWIFGVLVALLAAALALTANLANDWRYASRILRKWSELVDPRRAALGELSSRGEDVEKWAWKLGLPSRYDPAPAPTPQAKSPQGPVADAVQHLRGPRRNLLRRG